MDWLPYVFYGALVEGILGKGDNDRLRRRN
jgi:hypothetical protein